MAKIAVYDRFYGSQEKFHSDIAGRALAGLGHDVIGAATNIRGAAQQILDFAGLRTTDQPDIVIMGGMLDGEFDYCRNPLTITAPCTVRRFTWYGGLKERPGIRTTFLLPQFEQDGQTQTYRFPDIVTTKGVPENPPSELIGYWGAALLGVSARILSKMVETYLPEAGRIGVSGDPMFDVELSVEAVDRGRLDAVQQMRERIQRLAGEV